MTSDKELCLNREAWRRWNDAEPEPRLTAEEKIEWLEGFRELVDAVARGNSNSSDTAPGAFEKKP